MNNKICKSCGRANLPNANMCTNCGLNLPQSADNPFNSQAEDPLKTIAVGRQEFDQIISPEVASQKSSSKKEETKSSNKLYWILGGVAGLIVVGGFLIVVLAAGIYFYTSNNEIADDLGEKPTPTKIKEDESTPTSSNKDLDVEGKTAYGKAVIKRLKGEDSTIGKFKISKINNDDLVTFSGAFEAVTAFYTEPGSSSQIIHSQAGYDSWEVAKSEALKRAREFKRKDRKAIINSKRDYVNSGFKMNGRDYYMYCKRVDKLGLCQLVSSEKFSQLKEYMDIYYK